MPDPSLLPLAVGIIELATGCVSLALPGAFDIPAYPDALRELGRAGMFFVVGGVFTLLSYAARSRWSGKIPIGLALLGALPLVVAAGVSLARSRFWPAPIVSAALGIGVLADAWRPFERPAGSRRAVPAIAVLAAVLAAFYGAIALAEPALLRLPAALSMLQFLPHLGGSLIGAAVVLALGWAVPRLRIATQVVAAVPLLALAALFVPVGRWPAVLAYGLLGGLLAFEPLVYGLQRQRMSQRRAEPLTVSDYELATEAAAWGFVLLVAIAGSVETAEPRRLALAVLALVTSLFTFTWFHLFSVRGAGLQRTVVGIGIYSFLVAVLVEVTDGLHSLYFFVYFLPIVALAWTQAPQTIVVPLAIPLASLLTEIALAFRGGAGALGPLLSLAAPRAGGLLLVSGFSYMLARRNLIAQGRVRETNRQLEAVLSHMGEGLITTDKHGRITLCNPPALVLLGQNRDVRDDFLTEILPLRAPDGSPLAASEHPVRRALAGRPVPWERFMAQDPQGSRSLAVMATPLLGAQGAGGAIVLLRDVHTEVEMERIRDDFFFIASHELRTPLTVMKGNLEMALEVASAGPLKITLDEALRSVTRLIRMVNDFLDAARLEHGSLSLHIEEAYLPDLIRQAVEILQPDAARKGLEVTYRPTPGLPALRMDVERTLQILLNLLGNGVRYTNAGKIEIWHEMRDGLVETLIRDSGIGIAPENHARLFTRFGQVERGLTRVTGGSGLGLYISRRMAEQMGGTVVLKQSAPGQGSTFALVLPAAGGLGR